ncbi:unnamed protein product [Absidia cylindrospora]
MRDFSPKRILDEDDWPIEKVIQWLEAHGWGSVAPLFELNHIQGHTFLNLTMTQLAQVIPRSNLAYGDKRRLLHGIHSIQGNQALRQQQQQQQQQHSQNDENAVPSHYLDTTQQQQEQLVTTPTSYNDNTLKQQQQQQYGSPISMSRTPATSTQVPQLSYSLPPGSNSSNSSTDSSTSSIVAPSPVTTTSTSSTSSTSSSSTMESEYAKIRPYIPERKSSNPVQISKIMKQFNVPPTLPLARTRPNPIISRRPHNGNIHLPHHPSYHPTCGPPPPISPRQASGDMNGGWKISRRPGIAKPKQDQQQQPSVREQRIQVTLDSDTFFSLTVTGMQDPMTLKSAIVKKLGLVTTFLDQYQFYHENGDNSDTPLEDDELVYICGHSDNSKHRILLKSTTTPTYNTESPTSSPSTAQPQHYHHPPQQPQTASLWAVPPRQQEVQPSPVPVPQIETPSAALWAVPPRSVQQTTPKEEKADVSLWAVPPRPIQQAEEQQPSASLWAVPPRHIQQATPKEEQPNNSLWAVPPQPNEQATSSPLWAIPPRPAQDTNSPTATSATSSPLSSASTLWAVPPRPLKDTTSTPAPSPSASLWAVPPKSLQQHSSSPIPSPSSSTASSSATKTPASASLWAVPPKNSLPEQQHAGSQDTLSSGLWAIPPQCHLPILHQRLHHHQHMIPPSVIPATILQQRLLHLHQLAYPVYGLSHHNPRPVARPPPCDNSNPRQKAVVPRR